MTPQELKTIRKSLNLTQKQFAEKLGYTQNHIANLENSRSVITGRLEKIIKHCVRSIEMK